ncbi:MAG: hypothetical protein H6R13_643 [Proteobacteria bacterium]|nr:hypothetical protein [Pseudomonadota bacterium]
MNFRGRMSAVGRVQHNKTGSVGSGLQLTRSQRLRSVPPLILRPELPNRLQEGQQDR